MNAGDLVGGRYRLGHVLHVGDRFDHYVATHEERGKRVALRVLRHELEQELEVGNDVYREVLLLAALESKALPRVFDFGAEAGGAPLWIVTELFEGTRFDACLRERAFTPSQTLEVAFWIAEALALAHSRGIVHGSLRGEAILCRVGDDGRVELRVLEIAKAAAHGRCLPHERWPEMPLLAAPRLPALDPRADVRALGALLLDMGAWQPALPDLARIVDRCRAADPAESYANGGEVIAALSALPTA